MDSELLISQIKALRQCINIIQEAPPMSGLEDALIGRLREAESELHYEYVRGLKEIADGMEAAALRIKEAFNEGLFGSDFELPDLGTLYGHFDRAMSELREADHGSWVVV